MSRTVIHDPENALGVIIGWLGHYLLHKSIKGGNAGFGLTATEKFNPMHI
jgi:hypothetical protein